MFKFFGNLNKNEKKAKGFSLVELLVVLLIMSIIAGIAVPLYINQRKRAYLHNATADARAISAEINAIVSDYKSFGSATGNISITGGVLVFDAMTSALGSGLASVSGPGTTLSTVRLSSGSTLSSANFGTGTTMPWCLVISNAGSYAKFSNAGLQIQQVGGTAPTCTAGA